MSRGSGFSVTRDYPREIVTARQRLMQRHRTEKQNGSKISIEYPAGLVVNGRTVANESPDWYQTLNYDCFQLSCGNYSPPNIPQRVNETQLNYAVDFTPNYLYTSTTSGWKPSYNCYIRSSCYICASCATSCISIICAGGCLGNVSANIQAQTISTFSTTRPATAPRYTANSASNQGRYSGSMTTTTTFPTTNTTNFTTNTGTYNQSINVSVNGPRPRDNQSYTNL